MTREEAYNAMQEGYPVSHKDFGDGEYIYMDQNYFIKDENDNDFEASWDVKNMERWLADWYIYKGNTRKKRMGVTRNMIYQKPKMLISHIQGRECPGKDKCLQYQSIAGEGACLLCDINDSSRMIEESEDLSTLFIEQIKDNNVDETIDIIKPNKSLIKRIIGFIYTKFKR